MTIILGIDPGSRCTGFGVIQVIGNRSVYIASGCIRVLTSENYANLKQIFAAVNDLVTEYHPDEVAIEQVFVHANVNSALKLGQARGAAIAAVAKNPIKIAEYSARQIKQGVVGYGAADKSQVQQMVKILLKLGKLPQADEADALAAALCHANTRRSLAIIKTRARS